MVMNAEGAGMPAMVEERPHLIDMTTGMLIDPEDLRTVADALERLREARNKIQTAISAFSEVIVEESRARGTKTIHLGDRDLVVSPDYEIEWDISLLNTALPDAGVPDGRMAELLTTTVTWKVNARIAKQMASANPEYAKIIEAAQTKVPKQVYVSVKR